MFLSKLKQIAGIGTLNLNELLDIYNSKHKHKWK